MPVVSSLPVVFVDLGLAPFHPMIRVALEQRCRVVTVRWGADNMPRIERDALESMVDNFF